VKPDTLGVIGLGALGGSVAWQAAQAGVKRVIGYSPVPKDGFSAVKVGAVTEIAASIERVIELSDLVVLALPPLATVDTLERLASIIIDRPGYYTDVARVKAHVTARATELELDRHFAGSHPFVNASHSGFGAARPDMLTGKLVYVTPLPGGDVAAAEIADFWRRVIGAEPVTIDAETHDEILAWTSHLPQVVASALAGTLAKHGPKGVTYGSGALTTTRRAVGNTDMWTEILLMNRGKILSALDAVVSETTRLMVDIEAGDAEGIHKWLESGHRWRERL
jgi:prephenate dehydrogenase